MSEATYKYSLKSGSGYTSDQSGTISPERHGVICAVLSGGLSDDLSLLKAAPDLLESLEIMTGLCALKYGNLDADVYAEIEKANSLTAKARGEK